MKDEKKTKEGLSSSFLLPPSSFSSAGLDELPAGRVVLVAGRADLPRVRRHLAAGGRALVAQGDALVLAQGAAPPLPLGKCPEGLAEAETLGLLAALAAGHVLGLKTETLRAWLQESGVRGQESEAGSSLLTPDP